MNKIDWWLLLPAVLLLSLGLLILKSIEGEVFISQLIFAVIGIVVFIIINLVDIKLFLAFRYWGYVLSIILLIATFIFGNLIRGSTRWIDLGLVSIQSSEISKPILLLTLSTVTGPLFGLLSALPLFLIFIQPDLGTALVLGVGCITMIIIKLSLRRVILFGLLSIVLIAPLAYFGLHGYQRERIQTFFNPYADPSGKGYHVIQSMIAVGTGGLLGRGLGRGTQSQLRFLPEHHTDFIFAALSEELGFVGGGLVLVLYSVLLGRLFWLGRDNNPLILGIAVMLSFQIFVNIGMNIGVAPVTGITLPFLSYGGSSLVSLFITLGLAASTQASQKRRF